MSHPDLSQAAIRQQLDRLLSHPLFRSSKRYPALLRYVVEHRLAGGDSIKERTLGVEVLGRAPDYDTNADPVVRTSAGEIRKRIAQYYQEPGHDQELRIEIPVGSYLPEFALPPGPAAPPPAPPRAWLRFGPWALALLPSLFVLWLWAKPLHQASPLEAFWAPLTSAQTPVLLCVGQRPRFDVPPPSPPDYDPQKRTLPKQQPDNAVTLYQLYMLGPQNVAFPDVSALARVTGLLQSLNKPYRIRGELATTFEDLREGPVVLIGAFNNDWTLRITGNLRFSFVREGSVYVLRDRNRPQARDWRVDYTSPYLKVTQDYALISRVHDPNTGRAAIVAGGLTGAGTVAVGELLSSPELFDQVVAAAPAGWQSRNLQIVVSTRVIAGNSGPPEILAVHAW